MMYDPPYWHNGMLLQPEHFMAERSYLLQQIHQLQQQCQPWSWGFLSYSLDTSALSSELLILKQARGYFANGYYFTHEATDEPITFDCSKITSTETLYLTLPSIDNNLTWVRSPSQTLSIANNHDDATTEHPSAALNLKLQLTSEIESPAYTTLAIAKATRISDQSKIQIDDYFLPPIININAISILQSKLKQLVLTLTKTTKAILERVAHKIAPNIGHVQQIQLLQLLRSTHISLAQLQQQTVLHPFKVYQLLQAFCAQLPLFTLRPTQQNYTFDYNHSHILEWFNPLYEESANLLTKLLTPGAKQLVLNRHNSLYFSTQVESNNKNINFKLILVALTQTQADKLIHLIPKIVKIAPESHIKNLIAHSLPAAQLNWLSTPPVELPQHRHGIYFEVIFSESVLTALKEKPQLAVHVGTHLNTCEFQLWNITHAEH